MKIKKATVIKLLKITFDLVLAFAPAIPFKKFFRFKVQKQVKHF